MFRSAFSKPRFEAVGAIGNSMGGDRVKQLLVEVHADGGVVLAQNGNHRLEGFPGLDGSLETD